MPSESPRSASDPLVLTSIQRELLRDALNAGSRPRSLLHQRYAIRELCAAFGDAGYRPEQLLIAFKESLFSVATEAHLPQGPQTTELLSRTVNVFIDELYRLKSFRELRSVETDRAPLL